MKSFGSLLVLLSFGLEVSLARMSTTPLTLHLADPNSITNLRTRNHNKSARSSTRQSWGTTATATATTAFQKSRHGILQRLPPRGGACSDSNPALFSKIGIGALLETGVMLGVLVGAKALAATKLGARMPVLAGLPLIEWGGLFVNIFASSLLGSVIDGGMSVASNQALNPNVVPGDSDWYDKLNKPSWNPPGWVFPIMWLIVSKPTQMFAASKVLKSASAASGKLPLPTLAIYCGHLALGDAWNKVFFGLECPGRGVAVISAFWSLLAGSAVAFAKVDPTAGLFLLPTLGWVSVASALNWSIYLKNR